MGKKNTALEDEFAWQLSALCIPFEREACFIPGRKFRADFLLRGPGLVIEVQGGIWLEKGGHNTGRGLQRDYKKANLAQLYGWEYLQVTAEDVKNGAALGMVERFIEKRRLKNEIPLQSSELVAPRGER